MRSSWEGSGRREWCRQAEDKDVLLNRIFSKELFIRGIKITGRRCIRFRGGQSVVCTGIAISEDPEPAATAALSPAQSSCFVPEAKAKCSCYVTRREAQPRSASADAVAGSAGSTSETEILSQSLKEGIASAQRLFFLPPNQSGEKLQKRKYFIKLRVMTWLQSHPDNHSGHQEEDTRAQEGLGLSQVPVATVRAELEPPDLQASPLSASLSGRGNEKTSNRGLWCGW